MTGLARWCLTHRFVVLAVWLAVLAGVAFSARTEGTNYSTGFSISGTNSAKAQSLLARSGLGGQAGDDTIVLHTTTGELSDPAVRVRVTDTLDRIATLPLVVSVQTPYPGPATASLLATSGDQISADGRTAYANIRFSEANGNLTESQLQPIVHAVSALRSSDLQVELGGSGFQALKGNPLSGSEAIGLIAAAIILLIAFGSLLATLIPLVSAVLALGAAIETIRLLSNAISINSLAPTIAALIGLGVGIDYALFIVTRYRDGLRAGDNPEQATITALNTSGRAVIFAGATVAVAMLGLLILRVSFLTGIGLAAAIMVAFAVAAANTLLPAIFGLLGVKVLRRRERRAIGRQNERDAQAAQSQSASIPRSGFWTRWSQIVQRRPLLLSITALAVLVPLIVPVFSIRLGSSDQGNDPASSTTRKAYDLLAQGFGAGHNGPLELVAQTPTAADQTALARLVTTLSTTPDVASVAASPAHGGVSVVQVIPVTSPQSAQTSTLIDHLRDTVIPAAEHGTGLHVYVGGQTATFQDFATALTNKLPLFIAIVILLGALLLMLAFRSIVIPLTAAVMNLLAAAASFGVVVAVFQWGWGSAALGLGKPGPIESFLPVMLIAILFGLSMDYQVFLVSRIHEEWTRTGDNHAAVRAGQATTGRVITAAAAIMICVFLAFVFGGRRPIGEFGLGLAVAILLDALILRTILVPAAMHLLGRSNWWLPQRLDRGLPHVALEAHEPDPGSEQPELVITGPSPASHR